jgi:hypothetical protein
MTQGKKSSLPILVYLAIAAFIAALGVLLKIHRPIRGGESLLSPLWDILAPDSNHTQRNFYSLAVYILIVGFILLYFRTRQRAKGFTSIYDSSTLDSLTNYVLRLMSTPVGNAILDLHLPAPYGRIQLVRTTEGVSIAIPLHTEDSKALESRLQNTCKALKLPFEYPDTISRPKHDMFLVNLSNDPDGVSQTTRQFLKLAFDIGPTAPIRYEGDLAAGLTSRSS